MIPQREQARQEQRRDHQQHVMQQCHITHPAVIDAINRLPGLGGEWRSCVGPSRPGWRRSWMRRERLTSGPRG